jgi:hypothetical protein
MGVSKFKTNIQVSLDIHWHLKQKENAMMPFCNKGPFIYYVITCLGFLDPPPPLRQHVFSTKNKQKLAFSDPPSPPTSADVIYEWSLIQSIHFYPLFKHLDEA